MNGGDGMKKRTFIMIVAAVLCALVIMAAILSGGRAGGEIGFEAVVNRVEDGVVYATVTEDGAGALSKKLPDSIMFETAELDGELKAGDAVQGCYLSGTINGQIVRVVSITVKEQNAVFPEKCLNEAAGTITFFAEPVREAQDSSEPVKVQSCVELNDEQADRIRDILDHVEEWVDDHAVDRLAYNFDGEFQLADREYVYFFTYEYNVIYYDHYFAEIPDNEMQYLKDIMPTE